MKLSLPRRDAVGKDLKLSVINVLQRSTVSLTVIKRLSKTHTEGTVHVKGRFIEHNIVSSLPYGPHPPTHIHTHAHLKELLQDPNLFTNFYKIVATPKTITQP